MELMISVKTNYDYQNNGSVENTALPIFETWVKQKRIYSTLIKICFKNVCNPLEYVTSKFKL